MTNRSSSGSNRFSSNFNSLESLMLRTCEERVVSQQTALQIQINTLLSLMHAYASHAQQQAPLPEPDIQSALVAMHTVEPLIQHISTMLNLLVRAGVEINGNPFLDEDTTLHEIRQFLKLGEVMPMLPGVIYDLEPEQAEIVEDLLGLDPDDNIVSGGFFPAAEIHKAASFPLSDLLGHPSQENNKQEWEWIRRASGISKPEGAAPRSAGFVLDLGQSLSDTPTRLKPMLDEARAKGLAYLIFY
jgi:hypothetical protein